MAQDFKSGDLVWAKMKSFPPWPAKIVDPPADKKKKKSMHYVYFFGSNDHAWIKDDLIFSYEENKDKYFNHANTSAFKSAVQAIVNYSKNVLPKEKSLTDKIEIDSSKTNGIPLKKPTPVTISKPVEKKSKPKKFPKVKKLTPTKVPKTGTKRRNSDDESSTSSTPPKSSKMSNDKYNALLMSTPPNSGYSNLTTSMAYEEYSPKLSKESALLTRPTIAQREATPPYDVGSVSSTLLAKKVKPTKQRFGFLGLGIMGRGIVRNLINSKHIVTVWNRTPSKCEDFVKAGCLPAQTPADVVAASDITFCCVSDPYAAKELIFGNCGVLKEIRNQKGYVEMTSIDPETSADISEAIISKGGRYLEAPLNGSKKAAEEGTLIILAAGDRSLFSECESCFHAMGNHAFYLGNEIGNGSKMNLVLNMMLGTMLASLAEAMSLAERQGLSQKDLLEILDLTTLSCAAFLEKGQAIMKGKFPTNMPLQHMQKDLHLALEMADQVEQPLPLAAAANEVYKHARRLGFGEYDVSAIYLRAKF